MESLYLSIGLRISVGGGGGQETGNGERGTGDGGSLYHYFFRKKNSFYGK